MVVEYQTLYTESIRPSLQKQFDYKNSMEIPKLSFIKLNVGFGRESSDNKVVNSVISDLTKVSGQKPVVSKARKSIAGFKLREGVAIGCSVTLRGKRMYEFLQRFAMISLPRVRDFRGLSPKSFDGNGNYTYGVKEQIIFPEIDYDKIDSLRGMDLTFVTTAKTNAEGLALLSAFNLPFRQPTRKSE